MASDLIKAADDARRLLRGFTALAQVAEALEQVGQLEQRRTEAQARLDALLPKIEAAKAEAQRAKDAGFEHVEATKQTASLMVASAKSDAANLVAKAEAKAAEIVAAADKVSNNAMAANLRAVEATEQQQAKRDALLQECVALEARLAKAQASIAKLLG